MDVAETPELFDPIAGHYDRLSAVLSLAGIHAWHQAALRALAIEPGATVLDVGCGTGVVTRRLAEVAGAGGRVVGLDPSEGMLWRARRQPARAGGAHLDWVAGTGERLPFADRAFDRVTAQFSLRNMNDWQQGLAEMTRVVRADGRLVILDLVQPVTRRGAWAMQGLQLTTHALRLHRFDPYRWLGRSLLHAPTRAEIESALKSLGWDVAERRQWLGDLVLLLSATRPAAGPARAVPPAAENPRIVWATDGSATAQAAGQWLLRYGPEGARVDVVTVCPPLSGSDRAALEGPDRQAWRQALERAGREIATRYPTEVHLLEGEPGPSLLAYGRSSRPDLMLVGLKHRDAAAGRLLGAVAAFLLSHADWPVMAVPLESGAGLRDPVAINGTGAEPPLRSGQDF